MNNSLSAREHQPGVAYGTPFSNFRSHRRSRAAAASVGWRRRYIICCTAVEMFGRAILRDPRSRGGERMTQRSLTWEFLKVGDMAFGTAHAQTIA